MRLIGLTLLGLSLAAAVSQSAAAIQTKHRITDLSVVPIKNGINRVEDIDGEGSAGLVISACRETGTAGSYDRFMILVEQPDNNGRRWNVVTVDTHNERVGTGGIVDSIRNEPHTVEDQVASVVLAKGKIDGRPATLLIEGWRDLSRAAGIPAPTPVIFELYELKKEEDELSQLPPWFDRVEVLKSAKAYDNSDLALAEELGLPLSPSSPSAGGCYQH